MKRHYYVSGHILLSLNTKQHLQRLESSLLSFLGGTINTNNNLQTETNKSSWITCEKQQTCTSRVIHDDLLVLV
jgi:hypothetical protein